MTEVQERLTAKSFLFKVLNGVALGIVGRLINIQGTPASEGFGYSGLVGPINALKFMDGNIGVNLGILALAYIVIPVITGLVVHILCLKFKVYSPEIFKFQSGE